MDADEIEKLQFATLGKLRNLVSRVEIQRSLSTKEHAVDVLEDDDLLDALPRSRSHPVPQRISRSSSSLPHINRLVSMVSNAAASTTSSGNLDPTTIAHITRRARNTILENLNPPDFVCLTQSVLKQGVLLQRMTRDSQFEARYFVVRDSVLLGFHSESSAERRPECPQLVVLLAQSKATLYQKEKNSFMLMCGSFFSVFSTTSEAERDEWMWALKTAKFVTHSAVLSDAYFNEMCLNAVADLDIRSDFEQKRLETKYQNLGAPEYSQNIPSGGGCEGFVGCLLGNGVFGGGNEVPQLPLMHVVVMDSHLFVYPPHASHQSTGAPEAVVHLELSEIVPSSSKLIVVVRTAVFPDVCLKCHSLAEANRWKEAIRIASCVTATQAAIAAIHRSQLTTATAIAPLQRDLLDDILEPYTVQPFDTHHQPLFRTHQGRTVTPSLRPIPPTQARFSAHGNLLDGYNRPLPPGAVPMFAKDPVEPIGVGIDGMHYAYPSGREFSPFDPHYDLHGNQLPTDVVLAADEVIPHLKKAWASSLTTLQRNKTRLRDAIGRPVVMKRSGVFYVAGSPLGRSATLFDLHGIRIPNPMAYVEGWGEKRSLDILYHVVLPEDDQVGVVVLGSILVEAAHTTLLHAYTELKKHIHQCFDSPIVTMGFVANGTPIPTHERHDWFCSEFLPGIFVNCQATDGSRLIPNGNSFKALADHRGVEESLTKQREAQISSAFRLRQYSASNPKLVDAEE